MVPTPPHKTNTNWKIDTFLKNMQEVSHNVWLLVFFIEIDDQTKGFKGNNQENIWITYKACVGGFHIDAIFDCGFTYFFYFCNQPPQKITLPLDSYCFMLYFLLCLIPYVKTSISVTLMDFSWAQILNIHISYSTLKILRYRDCDVLVGRGFQSRLFRTR